MRAFVIMAIFKKGGFYKETKQDPPTIIMDLKNNREIPKWIITLKLIRKAFFINFFIN